MTYRYNLPPPLSAGFRRPDPGPRWHHGPVRLPVPDGHLRQRLHLHIREVALGTQNTATGRCQKEGREGEVFV